MELIARYAPVLYGFPTVFAILLGALGALMFGSAHGLLWGLEILASGYIVVSVAIGVLITVFTAIQLGMLDLLQDKERQVTEEKQRVRRFAFALALLAFPPVGAMGIEMMARNAIELGQALDFNYWVVIATGLMFIVLPGFLWYEARHRKWA